MKVKINKWGKTTNRRKIDIQIDSWDTWNMDSTLAMIIYPMLLQLKENHHGVPNDFADVGGADYEPQECFDFYKDTHHELSNQKMKSWADTLDKMIWSFQQIAYGDYDSKYHHGKAEYDYIKSDKQYPNPVTGKLEPTYQMLDKNPDEHWYDHVGHMKHEERIQEGIDLFAKYYRNLWD